MMIRCLAHGRSRIVNSIRVPSSARAFFRDIAHPGCRSRREARVRVRSARARSAAQNVRASGLPVLRVRVSPATSKAPYTASAVCVGARPDPLSTHLRAHEDLAQVPVATGHQLPDAPDIRHGLEIGSRHPDDCAFLLGDKDQGRAFFHRRTGPQARQLRPERAIDGWYDLDKRAIRRIVGDVRPIQLHQCLGVRRARAGERGHPRSWG